MYTNENTLRHLAARVSAGESGAAAELRQELQPHLQRIARRALRPTTAASPLARRIRATAARLRSDEVGPVASSLGEALVGRLQAGAAGNRMLETVCD